MNLEALLASIIQVGFPVVMCLLMYDSNQNTIMELKETISELKETISNNTMIITNLINKINVGDDDGK